MLRKLAWIVNIISLTYLLIVLVDFDVKVSENTENFQGVDAEFDDGRINIRIGF